MIKRNTVCLMVQYGLNGDAENTHAIGADVRAKRFDLHNAGVLREVNLCLC